MLSRLQRAAAFATQIGMYVHLNLCSAWLTILLIHCIVLAKHSVFQRLNRRMPA